MLALKFHLLFPKNPDPSVNLKLFHFLILGTSLAQNYYNQKYIQGKGLEGENKEGRREGGKTWREGSKERRNTGPKMFSSSLNKNVYNTLMWQFKEVWHHSEEYE